MIDCQKEFPKLWNLVASTFHQDADEEGLELDALMEKQLLGWGTQSFDRIITESQRALGYLDLDPNAFTPGQLGCDQRTTEYTTRSFVEMVLDKVQARKRALAG